MKAKVTAWGNSHGIRIPAAIMEHLKLHAGDDVTLVVTDRGVEILKKDTSMDYLKAITQDVLNELLANSQAVEIVDDPYAETDAGYLVIAIDPCQPIIRQVPKATQGAYKTLADAKEAARQILQKTIADAQESLKSLRQLGIDNISYISL